MHTGPEKPCSFMPLHRAFLDLGIPEVQADPRAWCRTNTHRREGIQGLHYPSQTSGHALMYIERKASTLYNNELFLLRPGSFVLGRPYACTASSQAKKIIFFRIMGVFFLQPLLIKHFIALPPPLFNLKLCCLWVEKNLILFLHAAT